jgi:hypothetical protein
MLEEKGFTTWVDFTDINPGSTFAHVIVDAIKKAAEEGYVLYLIDSDRVGYDQMKELDYATILKARVIPVWVRGGELTDELEYYIARLNILDVRNLRQEEQVSQIVERLVKYDLLFNQD